MLVSILRLSLELSALHCWAETYHYDAIGQLTAVEDTDPTQKDMKQQKHVYEYDPCGNMTYEYMRGNGTDENRIPSIFSIVYFIVLIFYDHWKRGISCFQKKIQNKLIVAGAALVILLYFIPTMFAMTLPNTALFDGITLLSFAFYLGILASREHKSRFFIDTLFFISSVFILHCISGYAAASCNQITLSILSRSATATTFLDIFRDFICSSLSQNNTEA